MDRRCGRRGRTLIRNRRWWRSLLVEEAWWMAAEMVGVQGEE